MTTSFYSCSATSTSLSLVNSRTTFSLCVLFSCLGGLASLSGCGPKAITHASEVSSHAVGAESISLTSAELPEARRRLIVMPSEDPGRRALLDAVLTRMFEDGRAVVEARDYEATLSLFAAMTDVLRPSDFARGWLPQVLASPARVVMQEGTARGDESAVLASTWVLRCLSADTHPEDEKAYEAAYQQVAQWGYESREDDPKMLQTQQALIGVWERHGVLSAHPDILETLAEMYQKQRQTALGMLDGGLQAMMSFEGQMANRAAQLAPLSVAAVYLRHGDLQSAMQHVETMTPLSEASRWLLRALPIAQEPTTQGADALIAVAGQFLELRQDVARGLCERGYRTFAKDVRFLRCLALVASNEKRYADATGWYTEAIRAEPDNPEHYDEAIGQLSGSLVQYLFADNPEQGRSLMHDAETILAQYQTRFPDRKPPIGLSALKFLSGLAETSAGHVELAEQHFEESLKLNEKADTLARLGEVYMRTGRMTQAQQTFRRAHDLTRTTGPEGSLKRAALLGRLGDAFRLGGNAPQAERMYTQALQAYARVLPNLQNEGKAVAMVKRAVLEDRLGHHALSEAAFEQAMDITPESQSVYSAVLSYLVVASGDIREDAPTSSAALANEVLRRALLFAHLNEEWRVYLALWTQLVHVQAGTSSALATQVFEQQATHEGWSGKLAGFGAGHIDEAALLAAATKRGQRVEATFYAVLPLLRQVSRNNDGDDVNDHGDANDSLSARYSNVMQLGMVSFFEHIMAQELAQQLTQQSRRE